MQELFTRFQNRGLQVLGLTEMRLSTTPEKVRAYIDRRDLTYPIAGAAPETREYFNLPEVPTVALIKRGKVVWCGSAARVSGDLLDGLLNGSASETPTSRASLDGRP